MQVEVTTNGSYFSTQLGATSDGLSVDKFDCLLDISFLALLFSVLLELGGKVPEILFHII